MNNFSINTNIAQGFENSITDYNKVFAQNQKDSNKSFDEIFSSMNQTPIQGGVAVTNNDQGISQVVKMAQDIKTGFSHSIEELNQVQRSAETDFETFAAGGDISIHEVMISAQKSNLAMQMAIQLRNQMLNAYNEFKNMSI